MKIGDTVILVMLVCFSLRHEKKLYITYMKSLFINIRQRTLIFYRLQKKVIKLLNLQYAVAHI